MSWIDSLLFGHTVAHNALVLAATAGLGLALGRIRVAGVSFGAAGTLFSGIALAHLGLSMDLPVLDFLRDFGLVLFVYAIGVQVGPGFLATLRSQGLVWNGLALGMVGLGTAIAVAIGTSLGLGMPTTLGILSGAVNNMPSLGSAQQTLSALPGWSEATGSAMTLACAVAYPFGTLGLLLAMILLRVVGRIRVPEEAARYEAQAGNGPRLSSRSLELCNPALVGLRIGQIPGLAAQGAVVTRLWREGTVRVAHPDDVLAAGDHLHVVGREEVVADLVTIIGGPSQRDLRDSPGDLSVQRILVTRSAWCGKALGDLSLPERFGVAVSRVERGEGSQAASPATRLLFADRLVVVGVPEAIEAVARELGNSEKELQHPQVLPLFLGILLGVVVGSVPIAIPGVPLPVKLGLAAGPMMVSIALARVRRIGPLDFYLPTAASLLLKEFGIVLFLSCVGLMAGPGFFDCLLHGPGLSWMAVGAAVTLVPPLAIGILARRAFKLDYLSLCGLLSGASTCPPALSFATTLARNDAAVIASATVYPLSMLARVVTSQVLALFQA